MNGASRDALNRLRRGQPPIAPDIASRTEHRRLLAIGYDGFEAAGFARARSLTCRPARVGMPADRIEDYAICVENGFPISSQLRNGPATRTHHGRKPSPHGASAENTLIDELCVVLAGLVPVMHADQDICIAVGLRERCVILLTLRCKAAR